MSGQFDAEIVNSLGALMARAQQAERAVKGTDKAVADLAKRLKATDPRLLSQLAKEAKASQAEINHLGHALGRVGGPLGGIVDHLTGGRGMSGGLARVAVGASVAGLALRAFLTVTGANVTRAREAAQAFREMSNAIQSGEKAQRSQALGAIGQKKEIGILRTLGGEDAVKRADAVAANGEMDAGAARRVVGKAYLIKDEHARESAINVAQNVAANGGDPEQAIEEIVKDKRLQHKLARAGAEDEVTNRVFSKEVGRRYDSADNAKLRTAREGDDFGAAASTAQGLLNRRDVIARGQLVAGGEVAAREELAKFSAPVAAAIGELARAREQELDALQKMANAEGGLAAAIQNLGLAFGGEGSATQQKRRKQVAFGDGG